MSRIRTLIADDDAGMRLLMRKILGNAEGFELLGEAENGKALISLCREHRPELVILDVEMPEMTGVECARVIQDMDPQTILIFATAHERYMREAFEVYAFDFLLKPFKSDRALRTLALVRERLRSPRPESSAPPPKQTRLPGRLMLKGKEGISFVDMDGLILIQREDRATALYARDDQRFVTSETLSELEARLPGDLFFRAHKSYIINVNQIDTITPYGRWTYVVRMRGTKKDALITSERLDALQKLFP